MASLRAAHLSGKWDGSNATLKAQIEHVSKTVDVMTFTEVADGTRHNMLKLDGWTTGQYKLKKGEAKGRAECAIMTRDSAWRMNRCSQKKIGPDLGLGLATWVVFAYLTHAKTGEKFVVSTCHMQSGVEGDWQGAKAKQYRKSLELWRKTNLEWREKYTPDAEMAVADWNLNAHKKWVQDFFAKAWPGLRMPKKLPAGGTHAGGRLIDFPLLRNVGAAAFTIYAANKASDHKAIRISGQIAKKKAPAKK
jgi:hypothetical protein